MKTIKISELSENLLERLEMVAESDEIYKISTGKGKEGVVLMSLQEYTSWKEDALKNAIREGLNSPRVENFNFDEHLFHLKAEAGKNG